MIDSNWNTKYMMMQLKTIERLDKIMRNFRKVWEIVYLEILIKKNQNIINSTNNI